MCALDVLRLIGGMGKGPTPWHEWLDGIRTNRRRKRHQGIPLDGWLATSVIDEALRVFGALMTSAIVDGSEIDDEVLGLETVALELLDDVSRLAPLAASAYSCPSPREASERAAGDDTPLPCRAIEALVAYTQRLAGIALVLGNRSHESAPLFAERAAVAEARIARLDS
jgi:hypothetical protein